jgi:hypothetical protein
MDSLKGLVESWLRADNYRILYSGSDVLIADKLVSAYERETKIIWVVSADAGVERRLYEEFRSRIPQYPGAKCTVVADSYQGFSRDFRQTAKQHGVKTVLPVQFFDTPFNFEEADDALSAIKELRDRSILERCIPQPYEEWRNATLGPRGDDLWTTLVDEIPKQAGPALHIIVGPAGCGKSVLFKSVFAHLYDQFMDQKRRGQQCPRPLPLIPDHLRSAAGVRVDALIDAFANKDVAIPVRRGIFEWMLEHGFATWMLDGLDELYSGDPTFFDFVADRLTQAGSTAKILVFARDSLIYTVDKFNEFLEEYGSDTIVKVYRLLPWDSASKRRYATMKLDGQRLQEGGQASESVAGFMKVVEGTPTLKQLTGLPYYCDLFLDLYRSKSKTSFTNDLEVLAYSASQIVQREIDKGVLPKGVMSEAALNDWLEAVAVENYESNFAGVSQQAVEDYAQMVMPEGLGEQASRDLQLAFVQFPIWEGGGRSGVIRFKHEIIAEYLTGRAFLRILDGDPGNVGLRLGRRMDLHDSVVLRMMAHNLTREHRLAVEKALREGNLSGRSYSNLMMLLLLACPERDLLLNIGLNLEGRDLTGVRFIGRDLSGLSFRGASLSSTVFRDCLMKDARLETAVLHETRFERLAPNAMEGARFGRLERFGSIFVDQRKLSDFKPCLEWVSKVTGRHEVVDGPCPAAQQLKLLFMKFIHPDGSGRRDDLKEDALMRGRQVPGAPSPKECLKACERFGCISEGSRPDRRQRARDDKYREMVEFVKGGGPSTGLRQVLGILCNRPGCPHVP